MPTVDRYENNLRLKLSVCLPTYNRAPLLQEALEAIASQGDATLFELVEVLVSDNASIDDTAAVVRTVMEQFPFLRLNYVRHAENIGMDRNLYGVVLRAAGEFVLVMSDDDVLLPGAVATLLELIEAHSDLDAICLNMRNFRKDPHEATAAILPLEQNTRLPGRDDCLCLFGTWITFLSIVAFRRSALRKEGYEERLGTYFVLSYLFLDVLHKGVFVLRQPLIAVRDNYVGGYNFFEVFVTQFQKMMNHAVDTGYSREATQLVLRQHLRTFLFPFLLSYKCRSRSKKPAMNCREGARRMLQVYGADRFLIFVMLPVLFAPSFLLQAAVNIRRMRKPAKL